MSDTPRDPAERLDSWKAIAAYLDRDERTAQRWERDLGLPVRRVPGGRGRSVFAYTGEIDTWLQSAREKGSDLPGPDQEPSVAPVGAHSPDEGAAPPLQPPQSGVRFRLAVAAAAIVVTAIVWRWLPAIASVPELRVEATTDGVAAFDLQGARRWTYAFPAAFRTTLAEDMGDPVRVTAGKPRAIFVATAFRHRRSDDAMESGALTELDADGRPRRSFTFDDEVTFDGAKYGPPWVVTTYAVHDTPAGLRIAIAAHHAVWDASLVTVLDEQWQRHGTFAHAGWIEGLEWLASNRLVIGGFSNAHDGGMIALLDPTAPNGVDGQGPEPPGSRYYCGSCPSGAPVRMAVMPRTEINRVSASRFNRARLQVLSGTILARTIEVPAAGLDAVDALYEFTPSLDLVRATYGSHYWEYHRALEAEGKLHRTREQSPDKDGPRQIQGWTPDTGWQTLAIR